MRPRASTGSRRSSLQTFISYLRQYFREQSTPRFLLTMLFVAVLVTINYTFGIERRLLALKPWPLSLAAFFLFYGAVLSLAWGLQGRRIPDRKGRWLLALAPVYFSCKMIHWDFSFFYPADWSPVWDRYATIVLQLPAKLLLLLLLIYGCRKTRLLETLPGQSSWQSVGLTRQGFSPRPYLLLLLFLMPVIATGFDPTRFSAFLSRNLKIWLLSTVTPTRHGPGSCFTSCLMGWTSSPSNFSSAAFSSSVWRVGRARRPYFRWPPSTARFILGNRWGNVFLPFSAAWFWACWLIAPVPSSAG